jgi:hypothetical protein
MRVRCEERCVGVRRRQSESLTGQVFFQCTLQHFGDHHAAYRFARSAAHCLAIREAASLMVECDPGREYLSIQIHRMSLRENRKQLKGE